MGDEQFIASRPLDWEPLRKACREAIVARYGLPPSVLGATSIADHESIAKAEKEIKERIRCLMQKYLSPHQTNISLYYPGAVITVNHYRGRRASGGEFVKEEARAWMEALGWMIKASHVEEWRLPLHVICSGRFLAENRAPDLSNLSKCTLDAIQAVSGVNDRDMRWHDGARVIDGAQAPVIFITITEAPEGQGGEQ